MSRHLLRGACSAVFAASLLTAFAPTPARAQAPMDPVTIDVVRSAPSYVQIRVTAGASGAPSGFALQWMYKSDFDAGGWPVDPYGYGLYYCDFAGQPTWRVGGPNGYNLGPNESINVMVGQFFDETGVYTDYVTELPANTEIVIRGHTEADGYRPESGYSPLKSIKTSLPSTNCTYTQGYWKNHGPGACQSGNNPNVWPPSVMSGGMTLGTVNYTATQLCAIFNTPAGGNGLLILAHQLIAAKLNILSGADPSAVSATIASANAMIGGLVIPPVGAGYLNPANVSGLSTTLDNYNNGLIGPGHCGETPTQRKTWGAVKSIYR